MPYRLCLLAADLATAAAAATTFACLFACLLLLPPVWMSLQALLLLAPHVTAPVAVAGCPALPLNMAECQNFGKVFKLKFQLRK